MYHAKLIIELNITQGDNMNNLILEVGASFEIGRNFPNQFCTGTPCIVVKIENDQIFYKKYPNHCVSEEEKKEIKKVDRKYIELIKSYY